MVDSEQHTSMGNTRRLTTVVAIDLCDFTRTTEQDESEAIEVVRAVSDLFGDVSAQFGGRIFSRAGDGFLAEFPSALSGLNAATLFAKQVGAQLTPETGAQVRIGLHVGDVIEQQDGDLLGHGVNIAARLQEMALPNQVLASGNVMSLVGHAFKGKQVSRGKIPLKNISLPIHAYDLVSEAPRFPFRATARWWYAARSQVITILICGFLIMAWLSIDRMRSVDSEWIEERTIALETALLDSGNGTTRTLGQQGISASYIRTVLQSLSESGRPTSRVIMTMILEGDVESAIQTLEDDLNTMDPENEVYRETLHQIGALAYFREPQKAVAVYEVLSLIDASDRDATVRLGQAYDIVNAVEKAREMYEAALARDDISQDSFVRLQLDLAFNQVLSGNHEVAIDLLDSIEDEIVTLNSPNLQSRFLTEYGIALERAGRLDEAEASLVAALTVQQKHDFQTEASRSYNVLGLIADKRATQNPERREEHLQQALSMFENHYRIDQTLGRQHGIAEAQYYLASVSLKLGNAQQAQSHALHALRIASEHGVPNIEFLTWLIMAEISKSDGDLSTACTHVKAAENLYNQEIRSPIGPRTAQVIVDLGCPFEAL